MQRISRLFLVASIAFVLGPSRSFGQDDLFPPKLPGGKQIVTISSSALLKPASPLDDGVTIAKHAPTLDFLYYPGQDYPGNPWSVWGDGCAVGDKYYSAIGDHKAPQGSGFVYEYDSTTKRLKQLLSTAEVLNLPAGHYMPGKIHSRIDLGSDGWLYFATHRGSTRVTTDQYHYQGDWILRHHPEKGVTEIVKHAPLARQCLPTSVLDPKRLIFYAGTADGERSGVVKFLAYDIRAGKVLYSDDHGPARYLIFSPTTGCVYFVPSGDGAEKHFGQLVRFDPEKPAQPTPIDAELGLRSATQETPQGIVYTTHEGELYAFDVKAERATRLGRCTVGSQSYIASIDADPSGRYLYYVAGAHGGSQNDGTPLVQFDVKTKVRKVVCFLHPTVKEETGYTPMGTYGSAVSPDGDKVYITWNGNIGGADRRGRITFNACALTVVHIPAEERQP
jgi:hypothetical protein